MTLGLRLYARDVPAERRGGAWVVEEANDLRIEAPDGPWQVSVEDRMLPWDASIGERGGVAVSLPYAVGRLDLVLSRDGAVHRDTIDVQPASHKLGTHTWAALLADLEAWLPAVTVGIEAARTGGLSLDGLDLPSAVEALLPLVPGFERALRVLFERPRTRERTDRIDRPIHRARRADAGTLAWISSHPREAAWLRPEADPFLVGEPPMVPLPIQRDVLDHPANRHIVWLTGRVARRLQDAADQLSHIRCSDLKDTRAWRDARCRTLRRAARRLRRLLRTGPLREVRPQPASGDAMMVLLDAPTYARAHQLGRRILASGFSSEAEAPRVATRPTYTLYELWCFLAMQRTLVTWLGPDWSWELECEDALLDLSSDGRGARFEALGPQGARLGLRFNHPFRSLLNNPNHEHSITKERRPDLTLAVRGPGGATWLALDAKYRVGRSALGDAFSSAHIYQHALRWPAFGGAPLASFLLSPRDSDTRLWFERGFLEAHRVGAIALRPGTDHRAAAANLRHLLAPVLEIDP